MKLIFTLTAGRTGTGFLAQLLQANLPDAVVHHEHLGWRAFGLDTPDLSHLLRFNNEGFTEPVRAFWQRKLSRILELDVPCYAETSHILMKAGLVEALSMLPAGHEVHLIAQRRDWIQTLASYHRRFDLVNLGNRYLWYLDPGYQRRLVDPEPFLELGLHGLRLWYLLEIEVRSAWYRLRSRPPSAPITVHQTWLEQVTTRSGARELLSALGAPPGAIELPPKVNAGQGGIPVTESLLRQLSELVAQLGDFEPDSAARPLLHDGRDPFAPVAPAG
ncbi:MAG TPA: hypothetical protein ENK18_19540 [Deltaproteobacteria bacterium]|nr:hypothetical protein [Deltaproteobacteria bacterium]